MAILVRRQVAGVPNQGRVRPWTLRKRHSARIGQNSAGDGRVVRQSHFLEAEHGLHMEAQEDSENTELSAQSNTSGGGRPRASMARFPARRSDIPQRLLYVTLPIPSMNNPRSAPFQLALVLL